MKANVTKVEKKAIGGELHVCVTVDFTDDSGKVVHTQEYGHLPKDVDPSYYQRQADVMESDIEQRAQADADRAAEALKHAAADEAIQRLGTHFQKDFSDSVAIKENAHAVAD